MNNKNEYRKLVRDRIERLTTSEKNRQSNNVLQKLAALEYFRTSEKIMAYWSLPDEINTHKFIETISEEKTVYLPVMAGENLLVKEFDPVGSLNSNNKYNISEPQGKTISDPAPDIIIVPGVAFDKRCNRMGRGKAFYDRFLSSIRKPLLIAIAFNEQIIDSVPVEPHDIPMDIVLTPEKTYVRNF